MGLHVKLIHLERCDANNAKRKTSLNESIK